MENNNYWYSRYVTKIFETPSNEYSEWFGYYNYDLLNRDQSRLLCGRSKYAGIVPKKGMTIEIGYYDISTGDWHHLGTTDSWNWPQGAMAQWLETENGESRIIYNCSKEGRLISRIVNVETGKEKEIDWPIYGITPDKKKSISLDLERSFWCRAYHYESVANPKKDCDVFEEDGIYEIDLEHNTRKKLISIRDVINTDKRPYFDDQKHWIEHIMINPSGSSFCFLHRFSPKNNVLKYETRLFIANIDGSHIQCIPGWDKVRWSHFGWCGDDSFVIYTYFPSKFNSGTTKSRIKIKGYSPKGLIKTIIRKSIELFPNKISVLLGSPHSSYQYYKKDIEGIYRFDSLIDPKLSRIDGHPSFTKDKLFMITDTYGDKKSWQSLYVYNLSTHKSQLLAKFFAYYDGKPSSCDLHPKLSNNNNYVAVDTAYNEKHHVVLFKIDWTKLFH